MSPPGPRVELHELAADGPCGVDAVVAVAVADATPPEVMPPDDEPVAPQAWTPARRAAYAAFLRGRPEDEVGLVVLVDGEPAGVARLLPGGGRGRVETGVWLGRRARGRGVGGMVLELLVARARAAGMRELVADTTADNHAALASLRRAGATLRPSPDHDGVVDARLTLQG